MRVHVFKLHVTCVVLCGMPQRNSHKLKADPKQMMQLSPNPFKKHSSRMFSAEGLNDHVMHIRSLLE